MIPILAMSHLAKPAPMGVRIVLASDYAKPTNNLISNVMGADSAGVVPAVGMGATALHYTDRRAGTIREVVIGKPGTVNAGKPIAFYWSADIATRTDNNGMSDAQSYAYDTVQDAPVTRVTLRRNGRWVREGDGMKSGLSYAIGIRDAYHDYSF